MKWDNKEHQFDEFVNIWSEQCNYYIWGTSNTSHRFYNKFQKILNIKGFIDNDPGKYSEKIGEHSIYSFEQIKTDKLNCKIIIASEAYYEIADQLKNQGYIENIDFCNSTVFVSTYFMYKYNKLYLFRTDISITNKCTLKCEKCNMLMPYFKNARNKSLENIIENIDLYFKWVDNLELLKILGGEPFLYPQMIDILIHLVDNYKDKIENIEIFTNGTIIPSNELLKTIKKYDISILISDYSNSEVKLKEKVDDFERKLKEYKIKYLRSTSEEWLDFGYPNADKDNCSEEEIISSFDRCNPPFRGLHDKKLYFCHLSASAVQAEKFKDNASDYFELLNYEDSRKKELMEFDLGYNKLGYVTFCRKCNGCSSINNNIVEVARQKELDKGN